MAGELTASSITPTSTLYSQRGLWSLASLVFESKLNFVATNSWRRQQQSSLERFADNSCGSYSRQGVVIQSFQFRVDSLSSSKSPTTTDDANAHYMQQCLAQAASRHAYTLGQLQLLQELRTINRNLILCSKMFDIFHL